MQTGNHYNEVRVLKNVLITPAMRLTCCIISFRQEGRKFILALEAVIQP
jgi:hypothetical protein